MLLAFVCNPDRMLGRRLPQALNDALAASQVVPATIIGRTAHAANNAAVAEDRTCTLERLQHFLESKRPRIFLFSGHADLQAEGRLKTLGFTTPDGEFAPLQEPAEIARLLGYA